MKKEEYLLKVEKQIRYIFDRKAIRNELEQHLMDSMEDLMEEGMSKEEAEEMAVSFMGDPIVVGKALNEEHHPLIGYMLFSTKIILCCFCIYFALLFVVNICNLYHLLTPNYISKSVEIYPVDYEVDTLNYKVVFDNICLSEEGEYFITYRSFRTFSNSRACLYQLNINVKSENGFNTIRRGGSIFTFGGYGYIQFEFPEDGLLEVNILDNDYKFILDLEEILYEKST